MAEILLKRRKTQSQLINRMILFDTILTSLVSSIKIWPHTCSIMYDCKIQGVAYFKPSVSGGPNSIDSSKILVQNSRANVFEVFVTSKSNNIESSNMVQYPYKRDAHTIMVTVCQYLEPK
jgi:hypothetical protein